MNDESDFFNESRVAQRKESAYTIAFVSGGPFRPQNHPVTPQGMREKNPNNRWSKNIAGKLPRPFNCAPRHKAYWFPGRIFLLFFLSIARPRLLSLPLLQFSSKFIIYKNICNTFQLKNQSLFLFLIFINAKFFNRKLIVYITLFKSLRFTLCVYLHYLYNYVCV